MRKPTADRQKYLDISLDQAAHLQRSGVVLTPALPDHVFGPTWHDIIMVVAPPRTTKRSPVRTAYISNSHSMTKIKQKLVRDT